MANEIFQYIGYDLIINEIPEGSRVLDLGCGDGTLLWRLRKEKNVIGSGVEISEVGVSLCIEKGVYCYHGDIDDGLSDYKADSFDYVILNQVLASIKQPEKVLTEIMRISRNAIICFVNFGQIHIRTQFLLKGKMPVNSSIPYQWYNSPNIHLFTIKDFENYCRDHKYPVKKQCSFSEGKNGKSKLKKFIPNVFASYGLFVLDGSNFKK